MKKASLMIFACFLVWNLFAQSDSTQTPTLAEQENDLSKKELRKQKRKARLKYVTVSAGFAKRNVLDKGISPYIYSGSTRYLALGYASLGEDRHTTFQIMSLSGMLEPSKTTEIAQETQFQRTLGRVGQDYHITDLANDKVNFFLGWYVAGGFDLRANPKFQNSAVNIDMVGFAGPSVFFKYEFGKKAQERKLLGKTFTDRDRNYMLTFQWDLPFFSMIGRKPYANIAGTNSAAPTIFDIVEFDGGLFKPFHTQMKTEFMYELHNQNYLSLSYAWNYYSYKSEYETKAIYNAMHIWSINAYFNLSPLKKK